MKKLRLVGNCGRTGSSFSFGGAHCWCAGSKLLTSTCCSRWLSSQQFWFWFHEQKWRYHPWSCSIRKTFLWLEVTNLLVVMSWDLENLEKLLDVLRPGSTRWHPCCPQGCPSNFIVFQSLSIDLPRAASSIVVDACWSLSHYDPASTSIQGRWTTIIPTIRWLLITIILTMFHHRVQPLIKEASRWVRSAWGLFLGAAKAWPKIDRWVCWWMWTTWVYYLAVLLGS